MVSLVRKYNEPFYSIRKYFGNFSNLARLLKINQANICNWSRRNNIPYQYATKINKLTGGKLSLGFLKPHDKEPFLSLFCYIGTSLEIAKKLKIKRQYVSSWISRGYIPEKHLQELSKISGDLLSVKFLSKKYK